MGIVRPEGLVEGWDVHEKFPGFHVYPGLKEKDIDIISWCVRHEGATQSMTVGIVPD